MNLLLVVAAIVLTATALAVWLRGEFRRRFTPLSKELAALPRLPAAKPTDNWLFRIGGGSDLSFFVGPEWDIRRYTGLAPLTYGVFFPGVHIVVLSDLDDMRAVASLRAIDKRAERLPVMRSVNAHRGLFGASATVWRRQRAVFTPFFRTASLAAMLQPISQHVQAAAARSWVSAADTGNDVDLFASFKDITCSVICEIGFGLKLTMDENRQLQSDLESLTGAFTSFRRKPIPYYQYFTLTAEERRVFGGFTRLMDLIRKTIASYRPGAASERTSIIQQLLKNADANKLDAVEIEANAMTFLLAGFETSSATLAFTVDLLSRFPDAQERARQEIVSVFGGAVSDEQLEQLITDESLKRLPYLRAVIKESMRMQPTAPFVGRTVVSEDEDVRVRGVKMPVDCVLIFNITGFHNNPKVYSQPDVFRPERWLENDALPFVGFGLGGRVCIGSRMAKNEMQITLVHLLLRYRLLPPREPRLRPHHAFVIKPDASPVRLERVRK